jgi:hypothetical protein
MKQAKALSLANQYIPRLQRLLRLDWNIEVTVGSLGNDAGRVHILPEYRRAQIQINAEIHKTNLELLESCAHECIHLSLGQMEAHEAVVSAALRDEEALRRTLLTSLVQAVESSVTNLEPAIVALYIEKYGEV